MRAVTWQGRRKVSVEEVPDPKIQDPTDAIIRITSTAICGSDLHLYEVLTPFMTEGDIIGHEPMGIVEEVGAAVNNLKPGDRVVIPFNVACGTCYYCWRGLQSQCETTQVTEYGTGATLLGYSKLYGQLPGGQAEYLRVPHADYGPIKVGTELSDEHYLFLSDILPTAWQAVKYAHMPDDGVLAVLGLGPVGQFVARIGVHLGYDVVAVDPVVERRDMAARHGVVVAANHEEATELVNERTRGRGADGVVDAVGMEAHGNPITATLQRAVGLLPDALGQKAMETVGLDRTAALTSALELAGRGGTVSLSGVYGGAATPLPMLTIFDKQLTITAGQCNVRNWDQDLLPYVEDPADPLGVTDLVTHRVPLEQAPEAYEMFQKKDDGCIKVVLQP
ncbi:alcohol dehydrogenase catalytic domain-containing protein [Enteractinococcus coprophilus]|uniref:Threonine dehydrogenase-like Zn-dependent dehydrogenase n=1 Tax=Enteractinococcus coprophilus TaxID=1027633 RepID=A0A543ANB2_9MICC|nr:alcohol dehydrogenase catalytic domain-containing protein [Enteractinococcus coprophilus]TQL74049.1 threonine dehydrogenase-like Zn-dependent dehydrogenase [Enteractinococcus coprophilus]